MKRKIGVIAAALALAWPGAARAAGLRTKFGEVVVRGLKIGQVYSLNSLLSLPLRVTNTGDQTVDLRVDVIRASSQTLHAGYEVIPSTDWVRLDKHQFTVEPDHEAVTDVVVSIPNDPALMGRRFEADIWSRTQTRVGMFGVGMQSRLLIQVASAPPTEDELKKRFVDEHLANLDFTLLPTEGVARDVPLGTEVDLKKLSKVSIKLINPNDQKLNFRIRSLPNFEALLPVPPGYEEAYDPKWLRPAEEVVPVDGNSIKETSLLVKIPDEARYRGKAFFFPVSVEILEQKIPARVYYKLMLETAATPAVPEKI